MTHPPERQIERERPSMDGQDPVLADLRLVEEDYRTKRAQLEHELATLRARSQRERSRAEQFRTALKEIQGALYRGDVYSLVLQSCVRLTGARRGLYLTSIGSTVRIRASVDMPGHPRGATASPFMQALARRVIELGDAVVCGDADTADLPAPAADERYPTCAAVPVAMRGDRQGVLVVADRISGNFDEDDLETLLHVGDQASVAVDNARLQRELEQAYVGTVGLLADAVEVKDAYTRGHCERVSHLSRLTARSLGVDDDMVEVICLAALLHDVGKIGVSDGILNKPGPLLPAEREVVKSHVRIGADLLQSLPALREVADVVLHHHEHFDGSGYPSGLSGGDIPIGARVVSVVDSYCAMKDQRSYKLSLDEEQARAELRRCAGSQFDPQVVDAFLGVLESGAAQASDEESVGCGLLPHVRRHRDATTSMRG